MLPGQMLPGQMSLWQLESVQEGPRNLPLKFGQNVEMSLRTEVERPAKVKVRSRQGQGKVKARSMQGQCKVKARSGQCQSKVKARSR